MKKIKYMREYEKAIDEANAFTRIDLDGNITLLMELLENFFNVKKVNIKINHLLYS